MESGWSREEIRVKSERWGAVSRSGFPSLWSVTVEPVTRKPGRTGGTYVPTQVLGTIPVTTRPTSKNLIGGCVAAPGTHITPPTSKWFEATNK